MNKIIVNDKNNFYFGREAEIVETNEINGKIIHRVQIENISFALEEKDVLRAWQVANPALYWNENWQMTSSL